MLTVHHLNNSRSQRILWLLEELSLPYEIKKYERDPKTLLAPPELKAIHPLGKSPLLSDNGQVIAESGVIIDYVVGKYGNGRLRPAEGTPERLRYNYWLQYAEGSAMSPMLLSLIFSKIPKEPMPFFVKPIAKGISDKIMEMFVQPQIKLHLDYMESELRKSEWFAGNEFSGADIQMSFVVEAANARGGLGNERPKLKAFFERIHARPAFKKALEKGGPFSMSM
jgi:glutathione S-transferase